MDYLCIIGINLGKNKSASHDKVTMYRLSYVNSHIILKNMCKFQLIIAQMTIGGLAPPLESVIHGWYVWIFFIW